ncbi:OsmC family protein [Halorientalis pallida]|uniref:OsmC family peroxiredoxin n=1 Tax=Halorientalis pallida TaxID=2479928 RepID=A0A498L214_9EURY|nr:OsmC family protein [Halorientalis pallida]RXK50166.1 OsmC family peroxiredoxin [Halorientalis pallida]
MASEDPQTETVQHGVHVGDHLEFVDWLEANPDDGRIEFRATGVAEDTVNRTTATIDEWSLGGDEMGADRDHTLHFGLPEELEESLGFTDLEERYEAIEGALAGLTACINGTIAFNAVREGIDVGDVRTRVRAPTDLRVLFGIHDTDRADEMFDEPIIEVEVTGSDLSDEDVERIREYPKRSPVYNLVTLAHPNDPAVTVERS